jgi:transcription elongation factor GreA
VEDVLLFEAQSLHPGHGMLAWLAAEAHEARGEHEAARRLAALALPELVAEKNYETAETALLLLGEETSSGALPALGLTLEILARQEAWTLFDSATELLGTQFTSPSGALILWPVVREVWRRHPDRESLRALALRTVRGYLAARYPDPQALLRLSEMERPSQAPAVVLDRLDRGERFPPGFFARHSGWGMGKIVDNDTQWVVVDFPQKPLHRMSMATAEQALEALAPGDFRVLLVRDPEGLKRLAAEDPASVVVKVLEMRKDRRAAAEEIRKSLVPDVMSAAAWPAWWKDAREVLAGDPRIDHRKAYANIWSLADATGADLAPVPFWDPGKDTMKNLSLLETFLLQHPGETDAVLEAHRERVERLAAGTGAKPPEAAAAALWLLRLDPASQVRPEDHLGRGFDMNALSRADQEMLLPRLEAAEALAAALNSRLAGVRRMARERLRARDEDGRFLRELLAGATDTPEAALEILETAGEPGALPTGGVGWSRALVWAVLELLERPPREAHRKRALAQVETGSPLDAILRSHPLGEEDRVSIASRLVRWQSSDRFRFPMLDFLRANGHSDVADAVEGARARAAARLSGRVGKDFGDPYEGTTLLTRITFDRLEAERQRVGIELKTTIPRTLQKARELGDLRENAEYESAKAKQAIYAKRFAELETYLTRIRLIDDLKREPGVAAPGTQVRLRETNGDRTWTYWILGEGDQEITEEVVSYRAPLGKLFLGVRVGDLLELPQETELIACRVESIEERLPSALPG